MQELNNYLEKYRDTAVNLKRFLYENPETGMREYKACEEIIGILEGAGFQIEKGIAGLDTAFRAVLEGKSETPRIAVLVEYDALPDIGHACGHNFIAAAGTGTAVILSHYIRDLQGSLVVIGTPAEETRGTKVTMVEKGVFDTIDAALMVHPDQRTEVLTESLASQSLVVEMLGKESHAAASPQDGVNALDALIEVFLAKDMLMKQLSKTVKTPGIIKEGGVAPNIVPARAVGEFSLRAGDEEYLRYVIERFKRIVDGSAASHGADYDIYSNDNLYRAMVTNKTLAGLFAKHLRDEGIEIPEEKREETGSLDMGDVSQVVPSVHPMISVTGDKEIPGHTEEFAEAVMDERSDEVLMKTIKVMVKTVFDLLTDTEYLEKAKKEFDQI